MNKQLSLFETPKPRGPNYSLFLAIFPDARTAQHITNLGNNLRQKHGLYGRMRPLTHLHVSLFGIDAREFELGIFSSVCKAVTPLTRPFEISFNRVLSFQGSPRNRPLVLVGDNDGNNGVKKLYASLYAEFTNLTARTFTPHITLLYDEQEIVSEAIEPVFWTVKEIALVCSEIGATKYFHLRRWALGD